MIRTKAILSDSKRGARGLAFLFLFLFAHFAPAANDSIHVYSEQHPLVYEDYWDLWPYAFLDEKGEPQGFNIDLLKLMLNRLDIPYVIKLKPSGEALSDLKDGKSDLMLGMDAKFHHQYAKFSQSVISLFTHSVVYQENTVKPVRKFSDLKTNRVIVHRGSFSHHLIESQGWEDNTEPMTDMRNAIQKVGEEPGTQVLWNTMSLKWLVRRYSNEKLVITPVDMPSGQYKFMSNNSQLLAQLDSVYTLIRSSDEMQAIHNKWFYPDRHETGIPSWIWYVAAALAIITLSIFIYYILFRYREKKMTHVIHQKNNRLALILETSGIHIWTYDIDTRLVTQYDKSGSAESTFTVAEIEHSFGPDNFKLVSQVFEQLLSGTENLRTLDLHIRDGIFSKSEKRDYTLAFSILTRHSDGTPKIICCTRNDITKERIRKQRANEVLNRYLAVFNNSTVDMCYYDQDGTLADLNQKACNTFHMTREEALNSQHSVRDFIDSDIKVDRKPFFHATRIKGDWYYDYKLVPVYDENDRLICAYGSGRDVSETGQAYRQLKAGLQKLESANANVKQYMDNINYVMRVGGVRLANYSPDTHILTIFSEMDKPKYELTQMRCLHFVSDESKREATHLLQALDDHTEKSVEMHIATILRTRKGLPLHIQIYFIPAYDDKGNITHYFGMCRDISEIQRTQQELEKEIARAQELENVKDSFLRNMSHEIRTPLNTIVGFAELFGTEHDPADEQIFINEIKKNSDALASLISNILFLSRIDAGIIRINRQPTDFAAVFETHCNKGWEDSQKDGVKYTIENPYRKLVVDIDEQNLATIIYHLTYNAAKYTHKGTVRARYDFFGDKLVITVEDTGEGIRQDQLENIINRYVPGNRSECDLGLSICHELVTMMEGTIQIRSSLGEGTSVWVSIPCKAIEIERKL
ncbi:MAG: transporter substrate-binding domain-containing protein [Prevotella sp.]|nr:transporter substrate-binding domain-containing protein [Prevotella sp.]